MTLRQPLIERTRLILRPGTVTIPTPYADTEPRREHLLRVLSAVTFLIFFQAYMVAPLIPKLAGLFGVSPQRIGLVVPAYLIPYGVSTLFYGLFSDRIGRRRIMLGSLLAFAILTGLTATSQDTAQLIVWRLFTGIGASGVVPLALALIGALFPYEKRGRPLGWLFGAMAGGMAFGSTFGVLLEPFLGWRGLFVAVGCLGLVGLALLSRYAGMLGEVPASRTITLRDVLVGYESLLKNARGARTYVYVLLNSLFHSAVFTWLGLYFSRRYGLGDVGIGLALLGYGVPGFLFGPAIGRAADRWGRRWLIPAGLGIAALSAAALILRLPVLGAAVSVTVLSLGYDMTQPLFAGIVTSLNPERAGQAMGLNVFTLFTGFGIGSFLFGSALRWGFPAALIIFGSIQVAASLSAVPLYRSEIRFPKHLVRQVPSAG
jgi:predicted MFS family arabinose efflux permease